MALRIGQRPDHGFDEPLGLLSDCHRRIEHFLRVLAVIAGRAKGAALGVAEREQLEAALTYFATAAPRHTADEEESLFPRMEASNDPNAHAVLERIRGLESDHDVANGHHHAVDGLVRHWLADDGLAEPEVRALQEHLAALEALYAAHIAIEDREVFPAAARTLSAADLNDIGREMAARRLRTRDDHR